MTNINKKRELDTYCWIKFLSFLYVTKMDSCVEKYVDAILPRAEVMSREKTFFVLKSDEN